MSNELSLPANMPYWAVQLDGDGGILKTTIIDADDETAALRAFCVLDSSSPVELRRGDMIIARAHWSVLGSIVLEYKPQSRRSELSN